MKDVTSELSTVCGGAAPNYGNNLSSPQMQSGGNGFGPQWSPSDFKNIQPANNMAMPGPQNQQFRSPDMNVTSPQNQSWWDGVPGMFRQMGM